MEITYGGKLREGDFIAIANGNHTTFGWYAGQGRGTLQYWWISQPYVSKDYYEKWLKTPVDQRQKWYEKQFAKGFTRNCIGKSYINAVHNTRVIKITHPEDILPTERRGWASTLEDYQKSKEVLVQLNIIKQ